MRIKTEKYAKRLIALYYEAYPQYRKSAEMDRRIAQYLNLEI